MSPALSNTAWRAILRAAGCKPRRPAAARARLAQILYQEFPNLRFDRERVTADRERGERMIGHLDAFARLYRERFRPDLPADEFRTILEGLASPLISDGVKVEAHLWWLQKLRLQALALRDAAHVKQLANARHADAHREWLIHRLCGFYLTYFQPRPTKQLPPAGQRRTPLVAFSLACLKLVAPKNLPAAETVRDIIEATHHVTLGLPRRRSR
jgi:hypothetical protein